ncbi:hypothetical protein HK102_005419 [Quaeritorhiza haematococci]|nr:hypothetical protein HK102_005419 [Quaeritorhiza haematococci]
MKDTSQASTGETLLPDDRQPPAKEETAVRGDRDTGEGSSAMGRRTGTAQKKKAAVGRSAAESTSKAILQGDDEGGERLPIPCIVFPSDEAVLLDEELDGKERARVELYLQERYGIAVRVDENAIVKHAGQTLGSMAHLINVNGVFSPIEDVADYEYPKDRGYFMYRKDKGKSTAYMVSDSTAVPAIVSCFDGSTGEPIPAAERRKAARYLRDLGGSFAGSIAHLFKNGVFMPPADQDNPGSGLTTRSNSPRRHGETPPANPDSSNNNKGGQGHHSSGGYDSDEGDSGNDDDGANDKGRERGRRNNGDGGGWPQDSDSKPDSSSSDESNDDGGSNGGWNPACSKAGSTRKKDGSVARNEAGSLAQGDTVLLALRNILEGQNWGRTQGLIIKHPPDAYCDGNFIYEYLDYLEAYGRRTFGRDATLPGWKDRFAKALVASIPVDGRQAESLIVAVEMLDPDTVTWEEFTKLLTKTFGSGTSRTRAYSKAFDDGRWVQRQKSAITTFSVGLKYAQLSYPKLSWKKQVDKVVSRFAESAPAGTFWTALAAILTQVGPNKTIHQVRKQLKASGLKEDVTVGQLQDKFGDERRKGPSKPRDIAPAQPVIPSVTPPTTNPPSQPANTISTANFLNTIGHLGQQLGQQLGNALVAQPLSRAPPHSGSPTALAVRSLSAKSCSNQRHTPWEGRCSVDTVILLVISAKTASTCRVRIPPMSRALSQTISSSEGPFVINAEDSMKPTSPAMTPGSGRRN